MRVSRIRYNSHILSCLLLPYVYHFGQLFAHCSKFSSKLKYVYHQIYLKLSYTTIFTLKQDITTISFLFRSAEDLNGQRRNHIFDLLSNPADNGEDEQLGNGSIETASRSCMQDATQAKSYWDTSEKVPIGQIADKTLLLFEDVDTVFDEDRGFLASIFQLAETAKRPIILTSNCEL